MSEDKKKAGAGTIMDSGAFVDAALKMQKQWVDAVSGMMTGRTASNEDSAGASVDWAGSFQKMFEKGMENYQGFFRDVPGFMQRMQQAMMTYSMMTNMWSGIPGAAGIPGAGMQQMMEGMGKPFQGFFESLFGWPQFAPGAQNGFAAEAWQKSMAGIAENWAGFVTELSRRAAAGAASPEAGKDALKDFYGTFVSSYENTVGRFVNMPAMGPARYSVEKFEKGADAFVKFQAAMADFSGKLYQTGMEALQEVLADENNIFSEEEITDESFDRFYHMLLTIGERRYHELFTSDLYCRSLESTLSSSLDFHRAMSELMEEMLKSTPIVTQSQADEVHKEIYLLKKRVAELEKKLAG